MLRCEHVTVRYGQRSVVDDVSFTLEEGQWLMLAGPNGAGKSTLLEAVAQGVPYTGKVLLEGRDVRRFRPHELARRLGVMAQKNAAGYAYTVEEVVQLGRYAHAPGFLGAGDRSAAQHVDQALALTGLEGIRRQSVLTLSGGELQRVFLAQVFAQDPQILLLDEPANHLDLVYQKHIFTLIGDWLKQPGRAVLSVVHDLSLARRFGTHAVLLSEGRCTAQGRIGKVMTPDNLNAVYRMDVAGWMRDMLGQWQ